MSLKYAFSVMLEPNAFSSDPWGATFSRSYSHVTIRATRFRRKKQMEIISHSFTSWTDLSRTSCSFAVGHYTGQTCSRYRPGPYEFRTLPPRFDMRGRSRRRSRLLD